MPSSPFFAIVDRRSFIVRAAAVSGLFALGSSPARGSSPAPGSSPELGSSPAPGSSPTLADAPVGDGRLLVTVRGRRYGLRFSDMRGGRHLVTARALEGRDRHAWSYPAGGRAEKGTLSFGGRSYTVSSAGRRVATDLPDVSIAAPEGDLPQTQMFRGLLVGLAAVITAIVGGEVEIENANGSKVTIKSNGAGGGETASEGGSGSGEGGGGSGEASGGSYRAEPGMEDDPGVWY